ncbi:hypothetical protein NFI96_013770 [Prochilodus magdalenae]|nr:hypothetical protein NFI96_013770 [Prochilodus magdalenae]
MQRLRERGIETAVRTQQRERGIGTVARSQQRKHCICGSANKALQRQMQRLREQGIVTAARVHLARQRNSSANTASQRQMQRLRKHGIETAVRTQQRERGIKADFISGLASHHSLHFLALTETWIKHENLSTPATLSSAYNFSHSPRQTGRGGGTGNFIDELDTLLSLFPVDGSPLLLLGDFNLPSDKLQSSCLQPLLSSFDLTLNPSPPTHRGGNTLDLVFSRPTLALDVTNQLQDINQSGFKPAHSTETALIAVTERLHAARSAKLSSVLILLDLSAAFDTVNHNILLSVLTILESPAPHGSGLSPTWRTATIRLGVGSSSLSLYTLSLGEVTTSHGFSYHCYADDMQLMLSFPSPDTQVCNRISAYLTDISSWMTAHHLKLNPSKTELLFIPSTTGPHCDLAISFGNSFITPTEDTRSLGVILDGQLSFSAHIATLTRSCRLLYNIWRIRPFLSQEATQLLF